MSAGRKSAMVVTPVRAAIIAASPIWRVEETGESGEWRAASGEKELSGPWWKMVWPWEAIRSRRLRGTWSFLAADFAASAKRWPRRKFSWLISAAGTGAPSAMRRIWARIGLGIRRVAWPRSLDFRFGGAPLARTRAASMPSAEVPDMRPRIRREFLGMRWF